MNTETTPPADVDQILDRAATVPDSVALAMRSPKVAITIAELAALRGESDDVVAARVRVIQTLRAASIRATGPPDWVLFKSPDEHGGQIVGYLQDCGADRVRDLWGIEIFNVSKPEKIVGDTPGAFYYLISGDGHCRLTGQRVESMEGGRSSLEDFCKGKAGAELELAVRKAARANLDGGITRELAGMKSVPIEELKDAWTGTKKQVESCRLGRGFGTRSERLGARSEKAPDVDPPICPHCQSIGVYRPAKGDPGTREYRAAFYGCPKWESHRDRKFIIPADGWVAKQQAAAPAAPIAQDEPPPPTE